ncbi:MAG: MerR family transcriptional regulator [Flavobacteriales bacterium]
MMRFQIRDLEGFSGVKAHTIRIWEKRYGLLHPDRTDTNIRHYGLEQLRSILNVAYLNQRGYKISKLAALSVVEREKLVREVAGTQTGTDEVLNTLKLAMLGFDEPLFNSESAKHAAQHGFRSLVEDVYVRLLEQIGVLWQTSSICPAQEHFVSNIIRQKLLVATDGLALNAHATDVLHVLYLP